jgi:hypothetical protein
MQLLAIRARIFERLWSPGIDSMERIPPAYEAWRAGTITLFLLGSQPPIDCLKIPALELLTILRIPFLKTRPCSLFCQLCGNGKRLLVPAVPVAPLLRASP